MRFMESDDEYERIAPYYDALLDPFLMPVRKEICRIAQVEHFTNMLDICCGTGRQCAMLAKLGFRVTGIDLSPGMLQMARKQSPASVAYFEEDAASLHFEDDSFDCAMISFALHEKHSETREAILAEARRVLRESGKILIVDYLTPQDKIAKLGHFFVNCIEWLAGESHYKHFRAYMDRGALQAVAMDHSMDLCAFKEYFMGTTGLLLAQWSGGF